VLVLAEQPLAEVADRAGAQPGDLHLARYHLALSEDRFPAVPQAADSSSVRQAVDKHPHLRLHRAVAALRQASAALKKSDQKETDLLDVIQQYITYSNYYVSEFSEADEMEARRLLAAIDLVTSQT
jgi:hypothetical protein